MGASHHFHIRPLGNFGGDWFDTLPELATHWGVSTNHEDGMDEELIHVSDNKKSITTMIEQLNSVFDKLEATKQIWKENSP